MQVSPFFAIDPIVNVEIMCLLNAKSFILLIGLFDWEFPPKLWQTSRMRGGANWQEANVSNVAVESSGATFYLLFVLFKSLPTIWPYWRLTVLTKYHWHIYERLVVSLVTHPRYKTTACLGQQAPNHVNQGNLTYSEGFWCQSTPFDWGRRISSCVL